MAETIGQAEIAAISKNRTVSATICQSCGEFGVGIFILPADTPPLRGCQVTKS
jgi:hypothetical protein